MSIKCVLNKNTIFHSVNDASSFVSIKSKNTSTVHFSLSVRAGHFFDPDDIQGLSHLLEHMLFLGSRQQPNPNQIIHHIQEKGGSVNAWTSGEFSNYHFSCPNESFSEIIPAFIDAIFHPLLSMDMIEKEIDAIDAEFKFKRKDELRRLYQIHKETCNPDHPFSKFSVGNAALFRQHSCSYLRSSLKEFHSRHYTKSNIRVALCGSSLSNHDIQTLTASLEHLPSIPEVQTGWPQLYRKQDLKIQIDVKPLQKARRLIVSFALQTKIKRVENALFYISHLLGDESNGSLLAYLKAKELATNLVAGSGIEGSDFKDFNVNIQLTEKGEDDIETILNSLFYTLTLIRKDDENWRRDEKAFLDNLAREHSESPPSLDAICEYADRLFENSHGHINEPCTQEELMSALGWMTTDNLRIKLISPNIEANRVCAYYDAQYAVHDLSDSKIQVCNNPTENPEIYLPKRNPYAKSSPKKVPRHNRFSSPRLINSRKYKKVWFSQELQFNSSKGDLYCSFDLPSLCDNAQNNAVKRIWLLAVNDRLQESLYHASIAGLHYRLYGHQCGFTLHCRGFTDNLLGLAADVLDKSFNDPLDEKAFNHAYHAQKRALANTLLNKPINRLLSRLGVIIQKYNYAPASLLSALDTINFTNFSQVISHSFRHSYSESLLHGNWTLANSEFWSSHLDTLPSRFDIPSISRHVIQLPLGKTSINCVECEHEDAAVVLYLQAPSDSAKDTAFCMIVEQLLAGPYFNALRTEKQLGYIVGSGYVPHNQHPGIAFYIQSPTHGPNELYLAMISFLKEQINNLVFYKNYWPSIRKNLLKQVSEEDTNLAKQSQRIWLNLAAGDMSNNRQKQLAFAINEFSFDELVEDAKSILSRQSFGELILYTKGKFSFLNNDFGKNITNLSRFKDEASFFD
ncbi:insulinase family protein [Alteromonas sp. 5E99-2]|uniref:insulinase family protein n=1 Tax=Alteromonas sp. 5E99-2 TaxID=2817683 RepID=UPI001A99FB79|nr:insulinase family protein [Alteromonas sp. 5E99-2]MBO1256089.1 insulinase family protein [Alteromonas sp. 5E99-2]